LFWSHAYTVIHHGHSNSSGKGATASLTEQNNGPDIENEDWARMPANGARLEGLSRPALYRLLDDPASGVVSVSLRQPGTARGVRLIGRKSLRAWIAKQAQEQLAARVEGIK
jgi:hypothetical protein